MRVRDISANFIASESRRVAPVSSVLFVFPLVKDLDKYISPLLLLVFILTDRKLLLDTPALELERHENGEEKHSVRGGKLSHRILFANNGALAGAPQIN